MEKADIKLQRLGNGRVRIRWDDTIGKIVIGVDGTDIITISRGDK